MTAFPSLALFQLVVLETSGYRDTGISHLGRRCLSVCLSASLSDYLSVCLSLCLVPPRPASSHPIPSYNPLRRGTMDTLVVAHVHIVAHAISWLTCIWWRTWYRGSRACSSARDIVSQVDVVAHVHIVAHVHTPAVLTGSGTCACSGSRIFTDEVGGDGLLINKAGSELGMRLVGNLPLSFLV